MIVTGRMALAVGAAALLALAAAGAGWIGAHRGAPDLDLPDLPGVPGFRTLAAGAETSAAAGNVLAGIGGDATVALSTEALCRALWETPGVPVEGPADARPRIAVFSDANCPYCRVLDGILEELAQDRPDLRLVHHEWPVLGEGSLHAARAVLAAERQGAAGDMRTRLLNSRFMATPAYLAAAARPMGVDGGRLLADMQDPAIDRALASTAAAARTLGLRGTPAVVVGGALAEGAVSRARIEALLEAEAVRTGPCP